MFGPDAKLNALACFARKGLKLCDSTLAMIVMFVVRESLIVINEKFRLKQ